MAEHLLETRSTLRKECANLTAHCLVSYGKAISGFHC